MSRDEFSEEDSRRFGHEYGGAFQLRWWTVHPDVLACGSVEPRDVAEMVPGLVGDDLASLLENAEASRLFPMHPWQASRLMLVPAVQGLFAAGLVRDLGLAGPSWRATTSLRTIHSADSAWMLKFSLDLKLTNSRRVIERHECDRGLSVHSLVKGTLGDKLRDACPTLTVLGEPAWMALRDGPDGAVLTSTIVSFRENPFQRDNAPKAAVLGALCERHPGRRRAIFPISSGLLRSRRVWSHPLLRNAGSNGSSIPRSNLSSSPSRNSGCCLVHINRTSSSG